MRRFLARLSNFLHRERADREMAREMASHLALIEDDLIRRGMAPEEARMAARRSYGGVEQTKELHRGERSFVWLEQLLQDVRHAWRSLTKSPGFVAVAVLSLAFGIGVNTAIFTLVNGILLKELPVPGPYRIVQVSGRIGQFETNAFSAPALREIARQSQIFSDVAGFSASPALLETGSEPKSIDLEIVTGAYFGFFGARPELGRLLNPEDDREGARPVCVLSDRAWRTHFGGDRGAIGRIVSVSGVPLQVIGVTGPAFTGAELQRTYDVWVPTTLPDAERASRQSPNNIWIHCLGRLKPGISFAEANVRMAGASPEIEAALPKDRGNPDATYFLTDASMGFDVWRTRLHDPLIILMAAVSLVLLLACANLANLMLARAGERRREFCIKLSLGVGRWRLLRQLLMETLALALAGCAAAILLSTGLTHYLLDLFNAGNRFSPLRVAPDVRVPLFAFAACMVTVAVAGLYPAWHAAGSDAVEGLRGASAQSGRRGFVRRCLILAQMALAIVLLFGAGIFTHSLSNLKRIDLGYDIRRVLAIQIGASGSGSGGNPEPPAAGLAEALARVRQLRVVESAAYSFPGVLSEYSSAIGLRVRDDSGGSRSLGATSFMTASPGYLATMRMTLLRGRDFTAADRAGAPPVAIVNQRFASRVWPGKEPVGMHVLLGAKEAEVVGLVADGKYQDFRAAAPRILYAPLDQMPDLAAVMSVRCRGPFGGLERDVRRIVQASAPGYQVAQVYSLEAQRDGQIPQERALAFLSSLFGALGTVLALVGIYGLISYSVTRRTQEVGVRMSVGAQAWDVLWLFARESLALTAIGMMLGLPLALILASSVKKMLFEVSTSDPLGIGVTLALITLGALAASYFPGRRATRIDPVRALRCD